ncbi:MAG: MATE family efflux transporter [Lachnospiraceae bacterium]|nr:MATE family efflux transporter [Lachnospiraceae bacterium]
MSSFKMKYIGDKRFYKTLLMVAVPMVIQNGITNFVNLLDNLMVGQLGTEMMSGVSIINQLMMVYAISIFGMVSGASIFSTQFYGQGNNEGMKHTFRFKVISSLIITIIWIAVFYFFRSGLINLFLHDDGTGVNLALAFDSAEQYLYIMLIGLIPFTFSQVYASTLRETGQTILPMVASIIAVLINFVGNYILIFGHFGAPKLGVAGAAIATVISRFVEAVIVLTWTHLNTARFKFMIGVYKSLYVPVTLIKQIFIKGMPLLLNETLWSVSQAMLTQAYSTRGLSAVAAFNISGTVGNLFNVVFISMGSAIAILVGQKLGSGDLDGAYDTDRKLLFVSFVTGIITGAIMLAFAPLFPKFYNTSDEVRSLAMMLLCVNACYYVVYSVYNATYFTLRSGGKTMLTFFFDSFSLLLISVPFAYVLTQLTDLPLYVCFALVQGVEALKCVVGVVLIKKKIWLVDLVKELS